MKISSFIPQFALLGVIFLLAACDSEQNQRDLSASLAAYIQAADQAQQQAVIHWDSLIIGNTLNCQQGIALLTPFDLSQSEANEFPEATPVRDHLNQSIALLTQSAQVWDGICGNPSASVPVTEANTGRKAAQDAQTELELARAAYNAWNP
jgi:hypothetical protein